MSDRRPKKLYVDTTEATDLTDNHRFAEASHADLLAAVRRGVESGTIEGAVVETDHLSVVGAHCVHIHGTDPGTYLVIPVDGEET